MGGSINERFDFMGVCGKMTIRKYKWSIRLIYDKNSINALFSLILGYIAA